MKRAATLKPAIAINTEDLKLKGFKVYYTEDRESPVPDYNRRDFYKICLVSSKINIHYADRSFKMDGSFLFFGNPHIPYSTEIISHKHISYSCLFTEDFIKPGDRSESLLDSPLFKIGGTPVLSVNKEQGKYIASIFKRMLGDQETAYAYKHELMRNQINLIIHEALKMQPSGEAIKKLNSSTRIASLFLDLLERQFPIESKDRSLRLKSAQDFAAHLAIHTNSLSRALKETTGKSTTAHIAERITTEAKALLHHTDWSVAEISQSLGFEYATYFNNFFKKMTGTVPKAFRS